MNGNEELKRHEELILPTRHMSLQDLPLQLTEGGCWELKEAKKSAGS